MQEVINTTIDNSSWTEIKLRDEQHCEAYGFHSRAGEDFKIKKTLGSTEYFTVSSGVSISITEHVLNGGTLFFAQLVSASSDVIEVIITK